MHTIHGTKFVCVHRDTQDKNYIICKYMCVFVRMYMYFSKQAPRVIYTYMRICKNLRANMRARYCDVFILLYSYAVYQHLRLFGGKLGVKNAQAAMQ